MLKTLAWAVLLLCATLSAWFGRIAYEQAIAAEHARFESTANRIATALLTRMRAYEDSVRAAANVLEARPDMRQDEFARFIGGLAVPNQDAGMHGLGFARHVSTADLPAYLQAQRNVRGPDYRIRPAGERDEYNVIDLIYPEQPGVSALLGLDVSADASRRQAQHAARDSGNIAIAHTVRLQDSARGPAGMEGFLLYVPVYDSRQSLPQSAAERRAALRGYASAGFGWDSVMQSILDENDAGLSVELVMLDSTPVTAYINQGHAAAWRLDHAERLDRALEFFGRHWSLHIGSRAGLADVPGIGMILALVCAGTLFGLLLFVLLQNLARAELRSRSLLDAVADNLPALIAYIGRDGRYVYTNRASHDWFDSGEDWIGKSPQQVNASNPTFLSELSERIDGDQSLHGPVLWETEIGDPPRPVQACLVSRLHGSGRTTGWYLMANDISEQRRAYRELTTARDRLRRVTDELPAVVLQCRDDEVLVFHNRACTELRSWNAQAPGERTLRDLLGERMYARHREHIRAALAGTGVDFEDEFDTVDGIRRMHVYYTPYLDEASDVVGLLMLATDISERVRLENELYDVNTRAQVTLNSIREAVIVMDNESRVSYLNPAAEKLSGWNRDEALMQSSDLVIPLEVVRDEHDDSLQIPGAASLIDHELVRRDGLRIPVEISHSPLLDRDDKVVGSVIVLRDISEARALSARMSHLALHDDLTSLPNRLQLNQNLTHSIATASRSGELLAVLFIDLDLFKHVNDALGHQIGDQLLQQVARRIRQAIDASGNVYRTGGDEFVVVLDSVASRDDVQSVADALLELSSRPYTVSSHELHQAFSIGISLYPDDGHDAATLMMRADAAMYLAKRSGRNASRFHTRELAASADARIELENSLRRGLRAGELLLHYQPHVDRRSGCIVAAEALSRWQRNNHILLPQEFLPIAEETNLIVDIDRWAIAAACRQNRIWQQSGLPPIRVSVNVAAANFDSDDLVDVVAAALRDSDLAPEYLELEVTETTIMRDVQRTDRILRALKALGVRIAIDDFGTGFSSLSYLGNYGFDVLKIDQSFVRDIADPSQAAITRAIIGLAEQLDCRTIAEGVETQRQAAWLARTGCDEMQGYLFSPPLPASEFARLLARGTSWMIPRAVDLGEG
ncbi:hypothetical protein CSC70_11480 [Pseudoxanthomonas kalamensis DSM 18571]|nr:hypothetical protein CSC70_11480 [Pseudoxanthomonas kalamensis DSM 18571]